MRQKSNIIIGIAMTIFTAVAIFLLFLPMFSNGDFGAERGNGFGVIFGAAQGGTLNAVPLLIVAFVLECVAIIGGIVAAAMAGKAQGLALGIVSALLIASGIIFLFSVSFYKAANADALSANAENLALQSLIKRETSRALWCPFSLYKVKRKGLSGLSEITLA